MTAPKGLTRRRRVLSAGAVPPAVADWFAGGALPWEAVLDPERVPTWWRDWQREHPKADHPAGAAWINWRQT